MKNGYGGNGTKLGWEVTIAETGCHWVKGNGHCSLGIQILPRSLKSSRFLHPISVWVPPNISVSPTWLMILLSAYLNWETHLISGSSVFLKLGSSRPHAGTEGNAQRQPQKSQCSSVPFKFRWVLFAT